MRKRFRARAKCVRCERVRGIEARGLCHSCYSFLQRAGGLVAYTATCKRTPWTMSELKRLKELRAGGMPYRDIAVALGRPYQCVRQYGIRYGLAVPSDVRELRALEKLIEKQSKRLPDWYEGSSIVNEDWAPEYEARLREMTAAGYTAEVIAERLSFTTDAVRSKIVRLGIGPGQGSKRKRFW